MTQQKELQFECKRPALRYYGGKFRIAPWIISHFPSHEAYVEVFGGAAGVLLRKPRSKVEIYNDLDSQVVGFFRVLRNACLSEKLIEAAALTPFSRDEFKLSYEASDDPVEAARRFLFRCYAGHGTCSIDPTDSNGFRNADLKARKSYAREWVGVPDALVCVAERIRGVTIENRDFRKLIPQFNTPDALLYVDPPYPMETRNAGGKGYVYEMMEQDHCQLAWLLNQSKAKIIVSSYPSRLYDELYSGWKHDLKETIANGQAGSVHRNEVIWMNF